MHFCFLCLPHTNASWLYIPHNEYVSLTSFSIVSERLQDLLSTSTLSQFVYAVWIPFIRFKSPGKTESFPFRISKHRQMSFKIDTRMLLLNKCPFKRSISAVFSPGYRIMWVLYRNHLEEIIDRFLTAVAWSNLRHGVGEMAWADHKNPCS